MASEPEWRRLNSTVPVQRHERSRVSHRFPINVIYPLLSDVMYSWSTLQCSVSLYFWRKDDVIGQTLWVRDAPGKKREAQCNLGKRSEG
ncbi:hypothetical protein AOLI_G00145900 [Acnodon oligacanthus]